MDSFKENYNRDIIAYVNIKCKLYTSCHYNSHLIFLQDLPRFFHSEGDVNQTNSMLNAFTKLSSLHDCRISGFKRLMESTLNAVQFRWGKMFLHFFSANWSITGCFFGQKNCHIIIFVQITYHRKVESIQRCLKAQKTSRIFCAWIIRTALRIQAHALITFFYSVQYKHCMWSSSHLCTFDLRYFSVRKFWLTLITATDFCRSVFLSWRIWLKSNLGLYTSLSFFHHSRYYKDCVQEHWACAQSKNN